MVFLRLPPAESSAFGGEEKGAAGPQLAGQSTLVKPAAPCRVHVERAGLTYHRWVLTGRLSNADWAKDSQGGSTAEADSPAATASGQDPSDSEADFEENSTGKTGRVRKKGKKKKGKKQRTEEEIDHYAVLGLQKFGPDSTDEQIKKAYHRAILKYHPDKIAQKASITGEKISDPNEDPLFLAIQTAYATLGDEKKRRGYDSQFEFDDHVPTGLDAGDDFFEVYGPVFRRNARFSERKPVPQLGTSKSSIERVLRFYEFWETFESWRDFSAFDEHNVEDAESREEKRWMMKENKNGRAKRKKAEYKRVRMLVEHAKRDDPRIRAHEQRLAKEKAAAKEARKRRRQEEQERKATEAQAEKERLEREAAEKKRQQDEERTAAKNKKKRLKKAKRALRNRCAEVGISDEDDAVETWLSMLDLQQAEAALADLTTEEQLRTELASASARKQAMEQERRASMEKARRDQAAAQAEQAASGLVSWDHDEIVLLIKATKKFPGGTQRRWHQIAQMVNTAGKSHTRTREECIKMSKQVSAKAASSMKKRLNNNAMTNYKRSIGEGAPPAPSSAQASATAAGAGWSASQQQQLEAALRKFPSSMDKQERWRAIGAAVDGKTKKQCVQRFKELRNAARGQQSAAANEAGAAVWTAQQQAALEAALKQFPSSMDKQERWRSIAAAVEGKTKKQCVARFKELRALAKKRQLGK